MKTLETARNWVESSKLFGNMYFLLGLFPPYRYLIHQVIRNRIDYFRSNRAYEVMIETSNICNARCFFCPNQIMKRKKMVMADDVFNRIIERIQAEKIKPTLFDLYHSGEPLTDKNLFNRIHLLKTIFPYSKIKFTTNFELANEAVISEMVNSELDSVQISLNASRKDTYERIMQTDFVRTYKNVEQLIEKRNKTGKKVPTIRISMVMCHENEGQVNEFVRRWSKADAITIQRPMDWGGDVAISKQYPTWQPLYPCRQLFERIVILSNGNYSICCLDYEGSLNNMNVKSEGLLEAFNSRTLEKMRQVHLHGDIHDIRLCVNCTGAHSAGMIWLMN